ncbi:MAG TPA: CocE/NonD family hydrolase C-terminal non-catalytic domain-containing protein [Acidimicrobiales bacterium]|nr:CocE/NonD family hydrolase C-terminal non-catalytic domain-containing protein [Acidimicrobiales bacterium]
MPRQSWINLLETSGQSSAFSAPPRSDPTSDWSDWFSDLQAQLNTVTTAAGTNLGSAMSTLLFQADAEKSPISYYLSFDSDVPILVLQGLDDGLMTPVQAQLMYQEAKAHDPAYPISVVWGDVGHSPAGNPQDLLNDFADRGNAFLAAAFGRGGSTGSSNESAYLMRCGANTGGGLTEAAAGTLAALETGTWTLSSTQARTTTNLAAGSESAALGNVNQSSCPRMAVQQDANVASWTWPVTSASTLLGAPVITLKVRTTGVDAQLDARLWVEDGGTQTLISTGPYRLAGVSLGLTDTTVTYEVPMTAWSLRPGEVLKLEITGDDAPTYQADLLPAITTIDSASLKLPTTDLATFGAAYKLSARHGSQLSSAVGNFVGTSSTLAGSYQATVDWGDGTVSSGTVSYAGGGWYVVNGTHTWAGPGSYQTKVTLVSASGVTVVHFGQATVS